MKLGRSYVAVMALLGAPFLGACDDGGRITCAKLDADLSAVVQEVENLGAQDFDNVERVQELETERSRIERELLANDCEGT